MKFQELGLSDALLKAVADKGYDTPSPIQAGAIPVILNGRDLLAAAQTGTGKTAGFTLPMIQKLAGGQSPRPRQVRALVLAPTRELAAQVGQSVVDYGKHVHLSSLVVFGGVGIQPQIKRLKAGIDILVATPGRLLDLCQQGACDLGRVEILVLDEADRMLDMGFINDIRKLVKQVPRQRQTLLFSATFSREIRAITGEFLKDPAKVEVTPENTAAETVKQIAYRCDAKAKPALLASLIDAGDWSQVLVFTRTKHGANRLSKQLTGSGIEASAIHGNKSQSARTRALAGFKSGKVRVLVATDIAARGIDINQLPHVINFELPNVAEDYVHRIGRTGRAGREGDAISLVCNDERPFFKEIKKLIKQEIDLLDHPDFVPATWPERAPTAREVMKAKEQRKQENRRNHQRGSSQAGKSAGRPGRNSRGRRSSRQGNGRRRQGQSSR